MGSTCDDGACADAAVVESPAAPLVMIILDTSASMERRVECTCTSPSCIECLPDCSAPDPQKNRWVQTLEALAGTYENFGCEAMPRVGPEFTYDADLTFPHHKLSGSPRDDGVLRSYADRLRFGIATFDAVAVDGRELQLTVQEYDFARSAGEDGLWS
jgi:hypothetical protein